MNLIDALTDLVILHGAPAFIRSDNGCCEIFNGRFRDELLNGDIFQSLREAQIIVEEMEETLQ